MRTLFDECFDVILSSTQPMDDSTDPLVWVLIALILFGVGLTVAVIGMFALRKWLKNVRKSVTSTCNEKTIQTVKSSTMS